MEEVVPFDLWAEEESEGASDWETWSEVRVPIACKKEKKCRVVSKSKDRCRNTKPVKCCCPCECVSKW